MCKLSNLETLIWRRISGTSPVSLPYAIWNLNKLRHLQLEDELCNSYYFRFPDNNLDNYSQLYDMDFLYGIYLNPRENINKLLGKFPNIRKLRSSLDLDESYKYHVAIERLRQLESLNLSCDIYPDGPYQFNIQYPSAIKKLTLSCFLKKV
ncbi:putative late blight resistance protein homolog R1A-3 [Coffea eugenioides]|uniref:Late blight resistance protein homolog R1A-3 n=1 Tax=Coffea arabica TaxID=13443 RepID=A0ABM4UYH9_COFAR|nr:putative late blight resistance protein homolog R1A-3 [Coffea eugenioides]